MSEPRILIANRGEIAVRVIRTCREMGIPTIAVYSDADREALHVEMADDAFHIGPASPVESYLNVARILEAAQKGRATMVHPGYGFLAENADFARRIGEAGMTFIGPSPESMEMMGDKIEARRAAERAGAPVVPGTQEPVGVDEAVAGADQIGFPMLVKAAFGGGGKGMRLVRGDQELQAAVEGSAREAGAYFGRPEVYLERYIERAHHVEAQILADAYGHYSFLGERDCTLQRRHQKLLEESPSPVVDDALRTKIGEAALAIARAAKYTNAGTIEFLVDEAGRFYFIEMNTRLQVEHPVTEFVAGLDLVRLQILVALDEPVELAPDLRGHAIECRINAEDPYRDFLPGPGLITDYRPPQGPFVRVDAGVEAGRAVAGEYDSLFAKLIVWGEDREQARRRVLRALDEFEVDGIPTTIPIHQWIADTEEFRLGKIHTRWVEEALASAPLEPPADGQRRRRPDRSTAGGAASAGSASPGPARIVVELNGRRIPVAIWDDARQPPPPPASSSHGHAATAAGDVIAAPMQGTILQVVVEPGEQVTAGDTLCILEAMKMENHIVATRDGTVAEVAVSKGDVVETGQALVVIEEGGE
ncbi:MAG TPA: biotin carboxylase N-terminal domain-containing protein [Actinomycetota bacterium]|nr:biotin carboxylase N-terminal domain-containing protein [Actinomycetota bacterium]